MSGDCEPEVRDLFDQNARTYDRVNSVISLGLDARWRGWVARQAVVRPGAHVLDAFAGTGLVGLRSAELGARSVLADFSPAMLGVANARALKRGLSIEFVTADLAGPDTEWDRRLDGPFDAISMVFGARYLADPSAVVQRLAMRLAHGGRFVLMDFAEPNGGIVSRAAAFYFFRVLPRIARLLAGRRDLYDRLVSTTRAVHGAADLEAMMQGAGLTVTETRIMGFGLVVGVVGIHAE